MSYSTNMAGLDLFTAPFRNAQASRTATASRPQQPKATTSQLNSSVSPSQQPKSAASQPVKPKAPAIQTQEPNILKKPVPTEKAPTVQTEQDKSPEPEKKSQAEAQAPAKAQPSAQAQSEPPVKELTMDMSDRTIPAGKPLDASEDAKRKAHEEAEAKRREEWEAREAALEKIKSMSDADIVSASTERVRVDTEKLTRRNMKECVAEHIQNLCRKDPSFARQTMNPNKTMIHCFHYINRMAKDYLQQEMKDNDIKPENGVYGGDVPDDLVYQWSIDYFNDPDAQEDHVEEEKFTPRPYVNAASKAKGSTKSKKTAKKETEKKQEPKKNDYQQMSLPGVS